MLVGITVRDLLNDLAHGQNLLRRVVHGRLNTCALVLRKNFQSHLSDSFSRLDEIELFGDLADVFDFDGRVGGKGDLVHEGDGSGE
jgi:hypothetical protein